MPQASKGVGAVVPAQLSFLALYNPSLGRTDETLHDQLVYYYSYQPSKTPKSRGSSSGDVSVQGKDDEQNERLRQIGLAQGMVEFAKAFSDGESIDSIDSEKSRILLHELEPGWWILASVNLTRIESTPVGNPSRSTAEKDRSVIEYSTREVCPQALLLQHILRAHSIFLLHHAPSLEELYARLSRSKFCAALERFWNMFSQDWDVLLHGNPAVELFNGLKLAAGGELGIGVGEEDWGSGEREVLEGLIDSTEGLVDMVVSRFGDQIGGETMKSHSTTISNRHITRDESQPWLGSGKFPRSSDGVIFSGMGTISRPSLKSVSAWMEWIYRYGPAAFGVQDNPRSAPRRKRRKTDPSNGQQNSGIGDIIGPDKLWKPQSSDLSKVVKETSSGRDSSTPAFPSGIPPPIVVASKATVGSKAQDQNSSSEAFGKEDSVTGAEVLMKYMTLGIYGSSWGIPSGRPPTHQQGESESPLRKLEPKALDSFEGLSSANDGHFLIGLYGNLESNNIENDRDGDEVVNDPESATDNKIWNRRIVYRTLHLDRPNAKTREFPEGGDSSNHSSTEGSNHDKASTTRQSTTNTWRSQKYDRLQVVVYVRQPFIFTFLFELHTTSLSLTSFYRTLHQQLRPLHKPLLASTCPTRISERLWESAAPKSLTSAKSAQPIYDLVYDPSNLAVHTTIPSIPEPGTAAAEGLSESPWSRIEALNVHTQILNTYTSTRHHPLELERTCKTSRGWWVVWMRLPRGPQTESTGVDSYREAFLIRKASDYAAPKTRKMSSMLSPFTGGSSGWDPGKLAEGIGIDTRRYIEGLLSLNR